MAPTINVSESVLKGLDQLGIPYELRDDAQITTSDNSYIELASGIHVARKTILQGKNWRESHQELAKQGARMITMPEFAELLQYAKENDPQLYGEITEVRSSWRSEWIDAAFEKRTNGMYILTGNKTKAEKTQGGLTKDRTPGISLESWIKNPTAQGLPKSDVAKGDLYFWAPQDGAVAGFDADSDRAGLGCGWDPSDMGSGLGVRAVRHE